MAVTFFETPSQVARRRNIIITDTIINRVGGGNIIITDITMGRPSGNSNIVTDELIMQRANTPRVRRRYPRKSTKRNFSTNYIIVDEHNF